MIKPLSHFFRSLLTTQKDKENGHKIQSFTFFIPSPPPRSIGYREKQFDKLFYEFINRGYKILNFTTQASSSGEKHSGMWIICVVQATNEQAAKLDLDDIFMDQLVEKTEIKKANGEQIDGLYYIDDEHREL